MKKESAKFGEAHFGRADFGISYNPKFDKAVFTNCPDRALFGVAHFGHAYFGKYTAKDHPRFGYTRFGVTNPIFESFKKEVSKSLI